MKTKKEYLKDLIKIWNDPKTTTNYIVRQILHEEISELIKELYPPK